MRKTKWIAFPHDADAFRYEGKALAAHWARLHRGDCEPFPSPKSLAARIEHAKAKSSDAVATGVQQAWRAYHSGEFQRAYELGAEIGLPGFAVTIKAAGVYASYLETNDHRAQELLFAASQRAEEAIEKVPDDPNAHYFLAYTLGRYSQSISIVEALARGLAPKIERALQQALQLEPKHAEAHMALALYHAEIIGKLGALAGSLTYGASADKAIEHFKKAVKLHPDSAIAKLEYAHGLKLLDRDAHADKIETLLRDAAECKPMDAMELLDSERAKELLEQSGA